MLPVNNLIPVCICLFSHLSYLTNVACVSSSQHLERIDPKILIIPCVSIYDLQQLTSKHKLEADHYNLNRKKVHIVCYCKLN